MGGDTTVPFFFFFFFFLPFGPSVPPESPPPFNVAAGFTDSSNGK